MLTAATILAFVILLCEHRKMTVANRTLDRYDRKPDTPDWRHK